MSITVKHEKFVNGAKYFKLVSKWPLIFTDDSSNS